MNRVFPIVALAALSIVGVLWYTHNARQRALESGDVYAPSQPPGAAPSQTSSAAPADNEVSSSTQPQETATGSEPNKPGGKSPSPPAPQTPRTQPHGAISVPASDSIPRNPPNGLTYVGSGKYQLYRQGDITWRLNTDTGIACILFATDAQWSRIRVYAQGCGTS